MLLHFRRQLIAPAIVLVAVSVPLIAQAPPAELRGDVLTDVGPVPAPATCGCVTEPFHVMRVRPGWGYGTSPGAPETDASPSATERTFQRERDRETLENLQMNVDQGLAGNYNASIAIDIELTAGTALKRDDVEAAKWVLLAATQGHVNAYVQLGHRYHRGLGLEQSDEAAAYWYNEGATHGDGLAMVALGSLYAAGRGVPQDWKIAVAWWRKANHHRFLGDAYACGYGVAPNDEHATEEYKKGAEAGDSSSAIQLAHMHAGRCAVPSDDETAVKWYDHAAQQGYPEAQIALAAFMLQGRAVGGPLNAYLWAKLAEVRLPDGELKTRAANLRAAAVRQLSPAEIRSTDVLVQELIAASRTQR